MVGVGVGVRVGVGVGVLVGVLVEVGVLEALAIPTCAITRGWGLEKNELILKPKAGETRAVDITPSNTTIPIHKYGLSVPLRETLATALATIGDDIA